MVDHCSERLTVEPAAQAPDRAWAIPVPLTGQEGVLT